MNKKSIVSIAVIVALIASIVSYNLFFTSSTTESVVAGGYRNGISLVPNEYDGTGVDVMSSYSITFEDGDKPDLATLEASIRIEPSTAFEVTEDGQAYLLNFIEPPLDKSSLYKFIIDGTSWLYMTQSDFGLVGSLPRNQATNVPFDTGIELYFTHQGGAEVSKYFEIEPKVKGSFENYGNTVVFVPQELEPQTLYTVTLKAGLGLKGSEETLSDDYVFSFETSYDDSGTYVEPSGYFNYRKVLNDFASDESIYLPFNYNIYKENAKMSVMSEVYQLEGMDMAIDKLSEYLTYPTWSHFNNQPEAMEVDDLDLILTAESIIEDPYAYEGLMHIDTKLETGFYLVKSSWENLVYYTFFSSD